MQFVFTTAPSSRPENDANAVAEALGLTPYEIRLAMAPGPPSIVLTTEDANHAASTALLMRSHGYEVQVFDDVNLVSSLEMVSFDRFELEAEGVRRLSDGDLLGYGDAFAVLRAVHETTTEAVRERENVAYFFRRTGAKPWILRERHATYVRLGADRELSASANFLTTLRLFRQNAPMAIIDDRLMRRRVGERLLAPETNTEGARYTTRQGIDVLAHLLAVTIASQGGSPYR